MAARVALALGDENRVLELTDGADDVVLRLLRARVHLRRGDVAAVRADLEGGLGDPEDPWGRAVLDLVSSYESEEALYRLDGPERATIPMDTRTPLPVVRVTVDGRPLSALLSTSADLTVVDESVMEEPGMLDRLDLGALTLYGVPALPRDLDPIAESIGVPVRLVIGLDVLLRLRATIDGRERWVVVRRAGTEAGDAAHPVPFVTLDGSFLTARASVRMSGARTANGWFLVDTAGLFPVALANETATALALRPDELQAIPDAPAPDVRALTLGAIRLGDALEIEGPPAATGLVPPDLSEVTGTHVAGMIGAQLLAQLKITIDPDERLLRIE